MKKIINKHYEIYLCTAFKNLIISYFRGKLLLGSGRFRIHPKDPQKTIVDYIICLDFNGPDLTKPVVESILSKLILQDAEYAREVIEKLKNDT